jgi:SAM-dependent methyltransferase
MAQLHRNVAGFGDEAAAAYDVGRAPFPPVLVDALGLEPGSRVLDLAAGTGLLSGALVDAGHDVVAVEPMAPMRARLAGRVGKERALEGTAEAIPLPDHSADAVTCADAFHWFDEDAAAAEIHRVLRPGGRCVVLFREADWPDAPPWWVALHERLARIRGPHPAFDGDRGHGAFDRHGGFTPVASSTCAFGKETDLEGVLAHLRSISYVGVLPENVRRAFLDDVRADLRDARVGSFTEPQLARIWTMTAR